LIWKWLNPDCKDLPGVGKTKHRKTKILTGSIKDVNAKTMAVAVVALGSAVRTNRETQRVVDNVGASK
jgi:hypothetical protein